MSARRVLPLAALLWAASPDVTAAQEAVPEILAAGIEEGDIEFGRVAGRSVRLWVEVDALPACAAGSAPIEIGFLIDADRDAATSLVPGLDLGPDARVHAACDPGAGAWASPVGRVELRAVEGGTRVEIETTVDRLPSTSFLWVAYARAGSTATVLPGPRAGDNGPPGFAAWAILERALP